MMGTMQVINIRLCREINKNQHCCYEKCLSVPFIFNLLHDLATLIYLKHRKMSEKAGDDLRHDLMFYWLLLRIEIKFPEIFTSESGWSRASACPHQRATEIDEANIRDLL